MSLFLAIVILFAGAADVLMAAEAPENVEQALADTYSPIMYLRQQSKDCGTPPYEGEPYVPLPVDMLWNNSQILIRDSAQNDAVIATGPSAQELATFGPTTYLDFPGYPLKPGCTYETDQRAWMNNFGLQPTTYARVIFDEENHRLALQYWFYWYFNHWNNTHESDWEGIQLVWDDIDAIETALTTPPTLVGYAQHDNGEFATWDDDKLQFESNTHPRVFPAAGSHATFFSDETYLGWGEGGSGFGCDMATAPSVRTPLQAVLIPSEIDPDGDFAWVLYQGRWGERHPVPFNGPYGPMFNERWDDPFGVIETWRPFSIAVPNSTSLGPVMSEAFCSFTESASSLLLNLLIRPWLTAIVVTVIIGVYAWFARMSMPIFRASIQLYRKHWKLFFGIGFASIPIGIIFNGLYQFAVGRNPLRFIVNWLDNTGGARLTAVMAVGGIQQLAMLLIVSPAIIFAVRHVLRGEPVTVRESYEGIIGRIAIIFLGFMAYVAVMLVLVLTAIGVPVAIWLAVKWQFFAQELVYNPQATVRSAFQQSFAITRRRWWKTAIALSWFNLLAVLPGILVGFGLLTVGGTAIGFANSISSLLYAVIIPLSVIAVTLLYLDRRDHPAAEESTEADAASQVTRTPQSV